jgi:hypothetical protein
VSAAFDNLSRHSSSVSENSPSRRNICMDFASANSFSLVFDDNDDDDAAKADPEFEEVLKEEGITIANVAADALIRALRLLELHFFVSSFVSSFPSSCTSSCCSCALTTFLLIVLAFLLLLLREERLRIKALFVVVNVVAEEEDISSTIYICVDVLLK